MKIHYQNVKKVRMPFRIVAGIFSISGTISIITIVIFFIFNGFNTIGFFFLVVIAWLTHLNFIVSKNGYPPQYLLWTSSEKEPREK